MRTPSRLALTLALTAFVVVSVLGCGKVPTAPSVAPSAPFTSSAEPAGLISTIGSTVGSTVDLLVGLIVRTLNLVGSIGGSLSNGRWRVVVPPRAVDGSATIALGVSTSTSAQCALEIWPADKNHFNVPATLTANCQNVPSDQLRGYVINWYDPATKRWVPVPGSKVDLTSKTVSAPLLHFSQYSAGPPGTKAGW